MTRNTKDYSKQQEKRIAKDLNGRLQPGSGAINITGLKGDVAVTDSNEWDVLIEAKTTMTDSGQAGKRTMVFHKEWIKEVQNHAFEQGKAMGIVVTSFDNVEDFYTLGKVDFINMRTALIDNEKLCKQKEQEIKGLNLIISELLKSQGGHTKLDMRQLKRLEGSIISTEYDPDTDLLTVESRREF